MTKIFVYGTLKMGFQLNYYLDNSEYITDGTIKGFEMFANGIPFIIKTEDKKKKVFGEVFEVDEETLWNLNRLESAYDLEEVEVNTEDGTKIKAFSYIFTNENQIRIYLENGFQRVKDGVFYMKK